MLIQSRQAIAVAVVAFFTTLSQPGWAGEFGFQPEPPGTVGPGQDLVLRGTIRPSARVRKARLRFRVKGEDDYQKTPLDSIGDDKFRAVIPGASVREPGVEYFVVIQDVNRAAHLIYAAPRKPAFIPVGDEEIAAGQNSPTDTADGASSQGGQNPETNPEEQVNPFETAEEYELRTGHPRAEGTSTGDSELSSSLSYLPPVDDDNLLPAGQDPDLLDEFAVFSAEDSTSLAASYTQKTSNAPAIISVVSRQRISQMGARTLLDVLKTVPGVETSKDVSGFDHVSFRGVRNDAEILLLVDGHRWNDFYDGRPNWAIPAQLIERVEIIRGPGSALYGTSAFMGVINVVTRETLGLWGDLGIGSFVEPSVALGGGFAGGGFSLYGAGDLSWTQGPQLDIKSDSATGVVLERRPEDAITQAWGMRGAASLKADYSSDALGGGKAYLRGQSLYELRGPYLGRYDTAGPDSKLSWLVVSGDVGYRQPILDSGAVDLRVYADQHNVDRTYQLTPYGFSYPLSVNGETRVQEFPEGVVSRTAFMANTVGVELRTDIPIFDVSRLIVGVQGEALFIPPGAFLLEMNRSPDGVALTGLAQPDASLISLDQNGQYRIGGAFYAQDEWQIAKPLLLTVGVRLSLFSDVAFDPLTHITPRAGLVWEIVENLNLKLLYATAFRAPTFEEKYDQTPLAFADFSPGVHLGNPDLLPEFLQTAETGLSYNFTFAGFRYRIVGNGFYSQIRNSIDRIDESGTQELLLNSGGRDVLGYAIDGRVEFTAGSYVYSNFSWFRAWQKVYDADSGAELPEQETLLTAVPQYRLNVGAHLEIGEVADLHLLTMFGGERRNNVRSTLESLRTWRIPAYALVNLSLRSKPIMDLFGFELSFFNLLDYPYLDDVPRPDRVTGLLPREGVSAYLSVYLQL